MAKHRAWGAYSNKGEGVHFPYGAPTHKELARIKEVARLVLNLERYRERRSRMGLYKVAAGFRRLGGYGLVVAEKVKSEARSL